MPSAMLEGQPAPSDGSLADQARSEIVPADAEGAKEAVTAYKVLRRDADATLLELTPKTGRMHQLRVQAAARGHPVLGDVLYGSTRPFGPPAELPRRREAEAHRCPPLTGPGAPRTRRVH